MTKFACSLARLLACALGLAAAAAVAQPAASAATPAAPAAATPAEAITPGDNRKGTFKTVQGEVTVVRGTARSAAVVGAALNEADRVLTGARSAAAVTLKDGTVISVGPDSVMDLSQYRFEPTTQDGTVLVSLLRGSLRMVTGLIAKIKPEEVKVTTPTTVIGVRGTDFIVEQVP